MRAISRVCGGDRGANRVGIDEALAVAANVARPDAAVLGQKPERPQDRIVLANGRDDVIARPQQAVQRQVERVGAVLREDDPRGIARRRSDAAILLRHDRTRRSVSLASA